MKDPTSLSSTLPNSVSAPMRIFLNTERDAVACRRQNGAVVWWLSVRTHNTGAERSNPGRVTMKTPLVRKATGHHLTKLTSLEKLKALSLASASF